LLGNAVWVIMRAGAGANADALLGTVFDYGI
jgi:hypothetical protein